MSAINLLTILRVSTYLSNCPYYPFVIHLCSERRRSICASSNHNTQNAYRVGGWENQNSRGAVQNSRGAVLQPHGDDGHLRVNNQHVTRPPAQVETTSPTKAITLNPACHPCRTVHHYQQPLPIHPRRPRRPVLPYSWCNNEYHACGGIQQESRVDAGKLTTCSQRNSNKHPESPTRTDSGFLLQLLSSSRTNH